MSLETNVFAFTFREHFYKHFAFLLRARLDSAPGLFVDATVTRKISRNVSLSLTLGLCVRECAYSAMTKYFLAIATHTEDVFRHNRLTEE